MKKVRSNPNQLELAFDASAVKALAASADKLEAAQRELCGSAVDMLKTARRSFATAVGSKPLPARRSFATGDKPLEDDVAASKRLVGCLSDQARVEWHLAWNLTYARLFRNTGFDAVAASGGRPGVSHFSCVVAAGKLPEFIEAVKQLIQEATIAAV